MAKVTELRLRDVRCFAGDQGGRLARITLLVGPNGAGKTTFLGCYKTFATLANLHDLEDSNHFDRTPFRMGTFDTIARSDAQAFSIGGSFAEHCHTAAQFDFEPGSNRHPRENRVTLAWPENQLVISRLAGPPESLSFEPRLPFRVARSHISYTQISTWLSRAVRYGYLPFNGDVGSFRAQRGERAAENEVVAFAKFVSFLRSDLPLQGDAALNVQPLNPAPGARERVYAKRPVLPEDASSGETFLEQLGQRAGLWQGVHVRRVDGGYAIMVDTPTGTHNLIDVGYGVHSLLPLAQSLWEQPQHTVFLLQQPEVHLHPEAQANLAQFMAEGEQGFLIETHSDHFVDRFRICVMHGQLTPDDLSILYFEPHGNGTSTTIHSIRVDESANLLNVPPGYRDFFDRETDRLLGFEDSLSSAP